MLEAQSLQLRVNARWSGVLISAGVGGVAGAGAGGGSDAPAAAAGPGWDLGCDLGGRDDGEGRRDIAEADRAGP